MHNQRNISLTLDDRGVAEASSLQITAGASSSGNVSVKLDGVETLVAVSVADSAIQVADKIRATVFTGYTVGGSGGTDTVTFTSDTDGVQEDAVYSEGTTGATGTMTTTVQGVDKGNSVDAYKIALDLVMDFEERIAYGGTITPVVSGTDAPLRVSVSGLRPSDRFTYDVTDLDPNKAIYKMVLV